MWLVNANGMREYLHGQEDWAGAARQGAICLSFRPDVEEERVSDDERSCYNCRYRRWTSASFACLSRGDHFPATACQ